jgi:hypothetical protein
MWTCGAVPEVSQRPSVPFDGPSSTAHWCLHDPSPTPASHTVTDPCLSVEPPAWYSSALCALPAGAATPIATTRGPLSKTPTKQRYEHVLIARATKRRRLPGFAELLSRCGRAACISLGTLRLWCRYLLELNTVFSLDKFR